VVTAIRAAESVSSPTSALCRVFLVRGDTLAWLGLRSLLADLPTVAVMGEATTAADALCMAPALAPDVIVLPGAVAGVAAPIVITRLRERCPTACFVILLDQLDPQTLVALGEAAVAACVLLSEVTPALLGRVLAAAGTGSDDSHKLWSRAVLTAFAAAHGPREESAAPRTAPLTPQQRRVLVLIAGGLSDQQTAARLDLSASTVASHIHELSARIGAANRFQIGWLAHELGLVSREEMLRALADRLTARIG